jgi:ABC-type multidrug transport system ATPase subunit
MQQRVKLILATCYQSDVLLLDEPTSHLDATGKQWYLKLLKAKSKNRLTLIFSNEKAEFDIFTEKIINIDN